MRQDFDDNNLVAGDRVLNYFSTHPQAKDRAFNTIKVLEESGYLFNKQMVNDYLQNNQEKVDLGCELIKKYFPEEIVKKGGF